jgi:hypothetical protein
VITDPRSNSTQVPAAAVPTLDKGEPEIVGALFHVIPVSVQVLATG